MTIMYVDHCWHSIESLLPKVNVQWTLLYVSLSVLSVCFLSFSYVFLKLFFHGFCKFMYMYKVYQVSLTCTSCSLKMLDLPFQHTIENFRKPFSPKCGKSINSQFKISASRDYVEKIFDCGFRINRVKILF